MNDPYGNAHWHLPREKFPGSTHFRQLVIMSKMFETDPHATPLHSKVYGRYEKLYTLNDFMAAVLFVIGSVMFFYDDLMFPATWCFTVGSINFMLRPGIKVLREFHLAQLPLPGDYVQ